jgi:hypothetical protein
MEAVPATNAMKKEKYEYYLDGDSQDLRFTGLV